MYPTRKNSDEQSKSPEMRCIRRRRRRTVAAGAAAAGGALEQRPAAREADAFMEYQPAPPYAATAAAKA
jgi:hypothetical protein